MKALIYEGNNTLEFKETDTPVPNAGEVLVKVVSAGICGSDLHAFHGKDERRPAPLILGHEVSGFAEIDGEERPVVVNPLVTCGTCPACLRGEDNLCPDRQIISMAPRPGSFAEYFAMPTRNLITLPEGFDMRKAALCEPIACGWHAVRLAERSSGMKFEDLNLIVCGAGAVGLGTALSARALGIQNIWVIETQAGRRDNAKRQGFTVIDPSELGSIELPVIDAVIDAVGIAPTRALASEKLRPGGTIVHIGLGSAVDGFDIRRATLQELKFIGSYTYTMKHFKEVVEAMVDDRFGALDWYQVEPVSEGQQWFEKLSNNEVSAAKVLLEFS
ncbi:MAG: alcohol dehydrogenase catalytic domain-containing protein [Oceanospirillaceae bacterium]|nr:alcohol dehydrogenase catalytic domain-containing protein [Oceanospirillaceae bacterium]